MAVDEMFNSAYQITGKEHPVEHSVVFVQLILAGEESGDDSDDDGERREDGGGDEEEGEDSGDPDSPVFICFSDLL